MRSHPAVLAAVTGFVTLAALTGCSVGFANGAASPVRASGSTSAPAPAPTRTFGSTEAPSPDPTPLAAVPSVCPDPAAVRVSLHLDVLSVDTNPSNGELECTYYNVAKPNQAAVILFGSSNGMSEKDWALQFQDAVPVPGVGDGAFYSVPGGSGGAINFYSGGITGYIYISGQSASPNDFAGLVEDQILDPR